MEILTSFEMKHIRGLFINKLRKRELGGFFFRALQSNTLTYHLGVSEI